MYEVQIANGTNGRTLWFPSAFTEAPTVFTPLDMLAYARAASFAEQTLVTLYEPNGRQQTVFGHGEKVAVLCSGCQWCGCTPDKVGPLDAGGYCAECRYDEHVAALTPEEADALDRAIETIDLEK